MLLNAFECVSMVEESRLEIDGVIGSFAIPRDFHARFGVKNLFAPNTLNFPKT
jgi:hypothetical protein